MVNEFDKKEAEIVSIREDKPDLSRNSAVTSPFNESFADVKSAEIIREIEEIKADLANAVAENNVREIFDYFDIGVFINRNGTYGITEYRQPTDDITFSDIGIDEEKLIENVVKISGNADFRKSNLSDLGKIQYIGGRADFRNSKFRPNMKLPKINGKIIFYEHQTLLQGLFVKFITTICRLTAK